MTKKKRQIQAKPTGTCFDDSLDFIFDKFKNGKIHYNLIHGICQQKNGNLYSHAWVEDIKNNTFIDFKIIKRQKTCLIFENKMDFINEFRPKSWTTYTLWQSLLMNWKWGNYGPWEHGYIGLTKDKKQLKKLGDRPSSKSIRFYKHEINRIKILNL